MADCAGWDGVADAPRAAGLMVIGVDLPCAGGPRVRPAAMVPVAALPRAASLVVVDLAAVETLHAVMATVSAVALRALLRRCVAHRAPPPPGVPRIVGTAGIIVYATGRTHVGRTWVWGDWSSAPPVAAPIGKHFRRGRVAHHFHSSEALGLPCPLCATTHTGGANVCHRCILANIQDSIFP